MKTITIEVSDKMYAELEESCHPQCETVESVARAMLFDAMYSDEISELWSEIDYLTGEFDKYDMAILRNIDRVSEILVMCPYHVKADDNIGLDYVKQFVHILTGIVNGTKRREELTVFKEMLEEKYGDSYPQEG